MSKEFFEAVKKGDRATVERMADADRTLLVAKDENGVSAVLLAHYYGQGEVAKALVKRKPVLDIFEAATAGDVARIRTLVAKDRAVVNSWSSDGFFALGLAAFFKRPEAARVLLENGADVRMASRPAGFTPLHSAVADDAGEVTKDLVKMLIDAGADPNAKNGSGSTPLHTAAFTGNVEVLEMLLEAGADATARDKESRSPLDIARERGHTEAAARLHDAVIRRRT